MENQTSQLASLRKYMIPSIVMKILEEKMARFLSWLESSIDFFMWNRRIRFTCKKLKIPIFLFDMYSRVQKDVLKQVYARKDEFTQQDLSSAIYSTLIFSRLYELNKEFPYLIHRKLFQSANAITRQVIDLYMRILYCRESPGHKNLLTGFDKNAKFPRSVELIKNLNKLNIELRYLKGIATNDFLDKVYADFCFYSELFHATGESFAYSTWVVSKANTVEATTTLLRKKPNIESSDWVVSFPKGPPPNTETMKQLIHNFYTYSGLILSEFQYYSSKKN